MMMMMMGSSRDGEEGHQAPPPLVMRAPQQALTPNHFVFGKLLGLGSYSKVVLFFYTLFLLHFFFFFFISFSFASFCFSIVLQHQSAHWILYVSL